MFFFKFDLNFEFTLLIQIIGLEYIYTRAINLYVSSMYEKVECIRVMYGKLTNVGVKIPYQISGK